jgi:hypothetical protein
MSVRVSVSAAILAALCVSPTLVAGCGGGGSTASSGGLDRRKGQSEFLSAPLAGRSHGGLSNGASDGADAGVSPVPADPGKGATSTRTVEETDLYRLAGDKLYYLNGYRGLMVFDVSDVAHPHLLGRSPIYGSPVDMIVRGAQATVIVADWYGRFDDGKPFHGSIVRGLDCTDPTNIKVTGEAKLGGWVMDSRVVGDVLYAVSEDYGWSYGWEGDYGGGVGDLPGGVGGTSSGPKLVVSAVSFGGGTVTTTGWKEFDGYTGIFNVTPTSIMLAHDVPSDPSTPYSSPSGKTELQYIDISDPGGSIAMRGSIQVDGRVQGWGADNGRWNLDFADGKYAHTIGCGNVYCGGTDGAYVLATADFSNPDAPTVASELTIAASGWSPAARFDAGRMYLSPSDYWYGSGTTSTPVQIFDVSSPTAPKLAGSTTIDGNVWLFVPSGSKLFALGNDHSSSGDPTVDASKVALRYLDVTDASAPRVIGTSEFGDGWAWTPAAGTFKAFTKDDTQGLVVLPFSGWSAKDDTYDDGVQLIEFTDAAIHTAGHANARGWVERGIFVNGKIVTLSDLSLTVVDYTDHASPSTIAELTLARNVVDAQPQGATISQLSSDWWGNDLSTSEYRVLPITDAEDDNLEDDLANVKIDGTNARVFHNGSIAYVVSNLHSMGACSYPGGPPSGCDHWTQLITVVDLSSGSAVIRGKISLPDIDGYWYGWGWGWYGCWYYDWFDGSDAVQIQGDALAFRRWMPEYDASGYWDDAKTALYVVDLSNPDAPSLASTTITTDKDGWWGNMRAVGDTLYTTHEEWVSKPAPDGSDLGTVKYYLDRIDLSDRAHPHIGSKINVPGVLVGASEVDPSMLYFVDYRWYGSTPGDELAVAQIDGDVAYLQGIVDLDGWSGRVLVRGTTAYLSSQHYADPAGTTGPLVDLHAVDLSDPTHPVDRISSDEKGWGWLLDVQGDRAIVTSGWGQSGIDIYRLSTGSAPVFDRFVRTRGWWSNSLTRQDDTLYLASGYWGVQTIPLK